MGAGIDGAAEEGAEVTLEDESVFEKGSRKRFPFLFVGRRPAKFSNPYASVRVVGQDTKDGMSKESITVRDDVGRVLAGSRSGDNLVRI